MLRNRQKYDELHLYFSEFNILISSASKCNNEEFTEVLLLCTYKRKKGIMFIQVCYYKILKVMELLVKK